MIDYHPKGVRCRACTKLWEDCRALPFHEMPVHRRDGNDAVVICTEFVQATEKMQAPPRAITRIYLSGPMTGLPDYNYPAFNAEAKRLRGLGYVVVNPAENPPQTTWEAYMEVCIPQVRTCDTIALLPGWSESRGSLRERQEAIRLGIPIPVAAGITTRSKMVCR